MNETNQSQVEVDPMTQAAKDIKEPEYPVIAADRLVKVKLTKASVGPTKDGKKEMLTVVLKTEEEVADSKGFPLRSGFTLYDRITLTPTPPSEGKRGRSLAQIAADVKKYLLWCGLSTKTPMDVKNNPSILEGYVGKVRTFIEPAKGDYAESNSIELVLPA